MHIITLMLKHIVNNRLKHLSGVERPYSVDASVIGINALCGVSFAMTGFHRGCKQLKLSMFYKSVEWIMQLSVTFSTILN